MNKDIRIATSFKGHRKRKRLRRIVGDKADSYLIDLWLTVAMDCPNGILVGWDEIDIADAVAWDGDPQIIVNAFLDSRWLEKDVNGIYVVHDWVEHNGYASDAEQRSNKSRFSRMAHTYPMLYEKLRNAGYSAISSSEYKKLTNCKPTKETGKNNEGVTKINGVNESLTNPLSPSPTPTPYNKSMHQYHTPQVNAIYNAHAHARIDKNQICQECSTEISAEDSECHMCGASVALTEF